MLHPFRGLEKNSLKHTLHEIQLLSFSNEFFCGVHEMCSHIMIRSDLFTYLIVQENRAPVTWSSVVSHACTHCIHCLRS